MTMQADDFRAWRKSLGWKQKDAADKLGLKKRVIQYYEKGDRDGKSVEIPRTVELACLALSLGFEGYDGGPVPPIPAAPAVSDAPIADVDLIFEEEVVDIELAEETPTEEATPAKPKAARRKPKAARKTA